jgi:predicted DNA-binding ribbon-helix-helix protein
MPARSFPYDFGVAPRRPAAARAPSTLINRNVTVAGHRTSVRLEPAMWDALQQICRLEHKALNELVTVIEQNRIESSLTAAIRVYLMRYFRAAAQFDEQLAGH